MTDTITCANKHTHTVKLGTRGRTCLSPHQHYVRLLSGQHLLNILLILTYIVIDEL